MNKYDIQEWYEIEIEWRLWRFIDYFIGHKWEKWGKPNNNGWVSLDDSNSRRCERCYKKDYKSWTKKELKIVKRNQSIQQKALMSGKFGTIYEVRFIETKAHI
jgi:hypothetical protein